MAPGLLLARVVPVVKMQMLVFTGLAVFGLPFVHLVLHPTALVLTVLLFVGHVLFLALALMALGGLLGLVMAAFLVAFHLVFLDLQMLFAAMFPLFGGVMLHHFVVLRSMSRLCTMLSSIMAFTAFAVAEDAISLSVDLVFLGFGHAARFDRLRGSRLRIPGMRFVGHGIGAFTRFAEIGLREFLALFGGELRQKDTRVSWGWGDCPRRAPFERVGDATAVSRETQ